MLSNNLSLHAVSDVTKACFFFCLLHFSQSVCVLKHAAARWFSSTHAPSQSLCRFWQLCLIKMFKTQLADTYFCARVSSLIADKNSVMQLREEHGVAYHRSFPGCQLIDWLLQNGEVESRRQGIDLCRALQEHGIVQHGEGCPRLPFGRDLSTLQPLNSFVRSHSHSRYQLQRSTTSSTAGCSTSSASTSGGGAGCLSCWTKASRTTAKASQRPHRRTATPTARLCCARADLSRATALFTRVF